MSTLYTAEALATGAGRNGRVVTADGRLDLSMAIPKEMGGSGDGVNPELLFASGYASCFLSALGAVARGQKVDVSDASVGSRVGIGPNDAGGFALTVSLEVIIPGMEHDSAVALAEAAHQVCPYSNATRGNIDVQVTVAED